LSCVVRQGQATGEPSTTSPRPGGRRAWHPAFTEPQRQTPAKASAGRPGPGAVQRPGQAPEELPRTTQEENPRRPGFRGLGASEGCEAGAERAREAGRRLAPCCLASAPAAAWRGTGRIKIPSPGPGPDLRLTGPPPVPAPARPPLVRPARAGALTGEVPGAQQAGPDRLRLSGAAGRAGPDQQRPGRLAVRRRCWWWCRPWRRRRRWSSAAGAVGLAPTNPPFIPPAKARLRTV